MLLMVMLVLFFIYFAQTTIRYLLGVDRHIIKRDIDTILIYQNQ